MYFIEPTCFPTGFHVKSVSKTSAIAHWNPLRQYFATEQIEGYDLSLERIENFSETNTYVKGPHSTSYPLGLLIPATEYWLRIAAVNSLGTGPYSPPIVFTTKRR